MGFCQFCGNVGKEYQVTMPDNTIEMMTLCPFCKDGFKAPEIVER